MSTDMLSRSEWDQLKTPEQIQEQIDLRAKLSREMVGTLYPGIIADEVCDLLDLKTCDNSSEEEVMHLETTWLIQLIELDDYHQEHTVAAVVRHHMDKPPRYISRNGQLWVLHEQHEPPLMAKRATYKNEGPLPMTKWEDWSND